LSHSSKSSKSRERVTGKEQYYTPSDVAVHCVEVMDSIAKRDIYLEPAGGTGAFIDALGDRVVVSYDIEPKHHKVEYADFLTKELTVSNVITITNPPFGRNHSLSIPFFNKCADVSDYIAFIIPKSWRKWSVLNRLDRRFHLVHDEELVVDYIDGGTGKLNTIYQIYEKRETLRDLIIITDHNYITKVKDPRDADVALTIFGRGCGKIRTEFESKPKTTQMYLKLNEPWVIEALPELEFKRFYENVAFTEALSINEINHLLNQWQIKSTSLKSP